MNQFFYQITRKASDLINSDDYRERNITRQTAFTRNRKLSFPVMIVLLLNFLTRTMQIELDDFFANVLDAGTDSVTKQAFFKARKNILPDAFKELFLMTRDMVLNKNKIKRHKGYRNDLRYLEKQIADREVFGAFTCCSFAGILCHDVCIKLHCRNVCHCKQKAVITQN